MTPIRDGLRPLILLSTAALAAGLAAPSPAATASDVYSTRAVLLDTHPYDPFARGPALPAMLTDPSAVYTVPQVPKPAYLVPFTDPVFGSQVMRIGNDVGAGTTPVSGSWGSDARHHYSKTQPWNSDGSLLMIENSNSPSMLILDGRTYAPRYGKCSSFSPYDYRWNPSKAHPHEIIDVNGSGTQLSWFDVTTCTKTRSWTLPIPVDGLDSGEGNPSFDGRFIALGNHDGMFVVDMDPQPPFAPWPNVRIGPVYSFPPCSLSTSNPTTWIFDYISVSPSGKYVEVKFESSAATNDSTNDAHRIYEVDPATLALKPHNMASSSLRCGSFQYRPNGWIHPLKHSDMTLNPFDNNEDVIIGGNKCPGCGLSQVLMVRLRDGKVTDLTDPSNEAAFYHTSCQNLDRLGWVYVDFFKQSGKRFSDEIVAVKLDGSKQVERLCHMHSYSTYTYRAEQHPVPSRDGSRVLFNSDWDQDCGTGCGSATDFKDYVVLDPGATAAVENPGPVPESPPARLAIDEVRPNPSTSLPGIVYSLDGWTPARLELVDVAGRAILARDLGSPGPGRHELSLGSATPPPPGIYWARLSQSGRSVTTKVTIMR